jgi:hypothetical protein
MERGACWGFEGEALLVWGRRWARPVLLGALHHTGCPGAPFVEIFVAGLTPALRRRTLAVGRGAPAAPDGAELATVKWWVGGSLREINWEERGLRLWAETGRTGIPASIPVRWLHPGWDSDGREAPARLHGWLTTARVSVEVGEGDPLAVFAGHRSGLLFSSVRLAVGGARLLVPRPARVPLIEPA